MAKAKNAKPKITKEIKPKEDNEDMIETEGESKCKGNMFICGLLGAILTVIGIYSIILGIKTQWTSAVMYGNWMAMIYYLIGILLISSVRMHMMKYHMMCESK